MTIGDKTMHYQHKHTNLDSLEHQVGDYLESDGYEVQISPPTPKGTMIQAKKGGPLRTILGTNRALDILFKGEPDDFTVHIGIGNWTEHLAGTAAETIVFGPFLVLDIPVNLWNFEIEDKVARRIDSMVGAGAG